MCKCTVLLVSSVPEASRFLNGSIEEEVLRRTLDPSHFCIIPWVFPSLTGAPEQAKRLTQEDYAMNHPAGRIGKRLILRVHDVMLTGPALPLVAPDTFIMEVRVFSHLAASPRDISWSVIICL